MIKYLLLITVILLSGCSTVMKVVDRAADVNDGALLSAEFTICNGASVGSVERRYNTIELLKARKVICDKSKLVVKP